jgi:peptide/nickel transport system permease protein
MKRAGLVAGIVLIASCVFVALFAPLLAPRDLGSFDLSMRLLGPRSGYPFGLDEEGRDLLSLVLWGARVSLTVSVLTVFFSGLIGVAVGLAAGYFGGVYDTVFTFVTDVVLSFPSILLVIGFAAFRREGGVLSLVTILSMVGWVSYARIVRGQVLSLKERDYVKAARGLGGSVGRIWIRHLLPNLAAPLMVQATFGMAGVILAESTLSFLGLGLRADLPSWGRLIDQGVQYLLVAPHVSIFPGLAMALVILGFNFLGDVLRDYFDVKEVTSI